MTTRSISPAQLKRLQTLWGQYCSHTLALLKASDRRARLAWASEQCERRIESFSDLSGREAKSLIDVLQGAMGIAETEPAKNVRAIYNRERARAAGTEGRKKRPGKEITLVSDNELSLINELMNALGWTTERLNAWLRSPSSPLKNPSNPQIRTLAQANRVIWAMKKMARRKEATA